MRFALLLLFTLTLATSCKKFIDKIKEDRIVDIMVDGQWVVTSYTVDGTNVTPEFSGYSFQYHRNKTVDAIRNTAVERTGTWDGNVSTKTVWADFSGAAATLQRLSGSWYITNNTTMYVKLAQTDAGVVKTMRLDKL